MTPGPASPTIVPLRDNKTTLIGGDHIMDEKDIRLEARFQALEYLVCNLHVHAFKQASDPSALAEERATTLREYAREFTVPGVDAAFSDMASAELNDALERLLGMIAEMMAAGTEPE